MANTATYIRRGRIFLLEQLETPWATSTETVSIRATGVARRGLELARSPIAYNDLVDALLTSTPWATLPKVEGLIATLWQHTLLFTDLRPPLTTDSPVHYFQQRIASIPPLADLSAELEDYLQAIEIWDKTSTAKGVPLYRGLIEKAQHITTTVEALVSAAGTKSLADRSTTNADKKGTSQRSSTLLQVDTILPLAANRIAKSIGDELAYAAELMLRLSPLPEGLLYLQEYRQDFLARYGEEREVAVLELLDPQFGLGIPSAYLGARGYGQKNTRLPSFFDRDQLLLELAVTGLRDRQLVIQLDEKMLKRLETSTPTAPNVPSSVDVYAFVIASSAEAIDRGEYQVVIGPNVGALQAGRNLGRFASMLGEEAQQALQQAAQAEATHAQDAISAELVYLHKDSRIMNVVIRPAVRSHEIIYGVMPGIMQTQVIPLDELVVGVRNDRFYLRWLRENKKILIRAGHMLNAMRAPAVIRLLSEFGQDGIALMSDFSWADCKDFPFLPRIQIGRIVLSLA